MPYIPVERREEFWNNHKLLPETAGELNFYITDLLIDYAIVKGGSSYNTYNEIVGVLECCKLEFVRRLLNPYEDQKIKDNTDVYFTQENKNEQA